MFSLCGASFIACLILFIIYKRSPIYIEIPTPCVSSANDLQTQQQPSLQIRVDNDIPLSPMIPRIDPSAPKLEITTPTTSVNSTDTIVATDSTTLVTTRNVGQVESNSQGNLKMVELEEDHHDFN